MVVGSNLVYGSIGSVGRSVCTISLNHVVTAIVGSNPTKVEMKKCNFILKDGGCIENDQMD